MLDDFPAQQQQFNDALNQLRQAAANNREALRAIGTLGQVFETAVGAIDSLSQADANSQQQLG